MNKRVYSKQSLTTLLVTSFNKRNSLNSNSLGIQIKFKYHSRSSSQNYSQDKIEVLETNKEDEND